MWDRKITMTRKLHWTTALTGIVFFLMTNEVLAASTGGQRNPVAGGGLLLTFAIVYLSRRRAVGGWLLYFYIQLYLSLGISFIFMPKILSNLNPSQWGNSTLYVMFFLSVVPVLLVECIEVFAATRLLFRRNEPNLKFLRNTLLALVASSAIALVIDIVYFKEGLALFFDVLTLFFALIWSLYFWKARRVRLVFVERNWVHIPYSKRRALTPKDKKYLRKRVAIAIVVTFVLLLLWVGVRVEDKKPDLSIFWVPLFYSVIVAIIAWYLPIRKKKQEPSQGAGVDSESNL